MARYIDSEALTEEIKSLSVMLGGENVFKTAKESLLRIIDEQPTADVVEVKHGEWVKNGKTHTCSCCGYFYINVDMEDDNYCPNCGAKMDGGKKE